MRILKFVSLLLCVIAVSSCSNDADSLGVGAECTTNSQCDEANNQSCLAFKGGYCGIQGCTSDGNCPTSSACVTHDDQNYCFRTCNEKTECNANRTIENEANCVANLTYVDTLYSDKACVPPSG